MPQDELLSPTRRSLRLAQRPPATEDPPPVRMGRRSPRLALKTKRTEDPPPVRKPRRKTHQWKTKRPWAPPPKPYYKRPPPPPGPMPPDIKELNDRLYSKYGVTISTGFSEPGPEFDRDMWVKYYKELRESDGFDFTPFPVAQRSIRVTVFDMDYIATTRDGHKELKGYATEALEEYNKVNKTTWEFDDIDYLNGGVCGTLNYYITFTAKTASRKQTFQLKVVITPARRSITYPICREKKNTTAASESTSLPLKAYNFL